MKKYSTLFIFAFFSIIAFASIPHFARADITSNLVDWYKFDDGSGSTATDAGSAGNTITLSNGASWGAGKIGGSSLTLNGTNQYAQLPASSFSGYPTSGSSNAFTLTFSTWFKTTTPGMIFAQDAAVLPPGGVGGYVPAIYIDTNGKIRESIFWHGGTAYQIISSASYNDGNWHQVVGVYNAGTETLYVDGVSVGSQTQAENGYSATYYYFLGVGYGGGWPNTNSSWVYFNGSFDDTRIYNRALSASDVSELYSYTGLVTGGGNSQAQQQATGPIPPNQLSGWAWSSNIGWISFNSADAGAGGGGQYAVTVSTSTGSSIGTLGGYAWSPNIGWIKFGALSGFPSGDGVPQNAQIDFSTGAVSGWIRACAGTTDGRCGTMTSRTDGWDGWINLSGGTHASPTTGGTGGITLDPTTGLLNGYAWGSNVVGWLTFNSTVSIGNNPGCTVCGCPGQPVCPPGGNPPTCSLSTTPSTLPLGGGSATITWTSTNATACQGENFSTGGATSGSATQSVVQNTSYTLSCSNATYTTPQFCSSATVSVQNTSSGLKLFIGPTASALSPLTVNSPGHDTLRVRQGVPFALKWINQLSTDYTCNSTSFKPDGSDASAIWAWDGSPTGTQSGISTNGIPIGQYSFKIRCVSSDGTSTINSGVQLDVTKSSITEH